MKRKILWLSISCLMILSLVLVSCGKTTPATTTATQTQTTATATTTAPTTVKTTTVTTTPLPTVTTTTTAAGTPQYGGILRIGDYRLSTILGNPAKEAEAYGQKQAAPAIETLLRIAATGEVVPNLAKSWATDPVGKTITLTLNTGIMFQDGTPFNAAAVKWNLDQDIAAKQIGYTLIKSVDVVNDSTVRINLVNWDNTLLDSLGYSYIGMMISPTAYQKNGGENWANNNPVGTGPFIFETWIKEVTISYSKNPNYWRAGKPYLDRVENIIVADQTVGLLNFKKNNTDMLMDPLTTDLPALVKNYPATTILPFAAYATVRAGAIFDSADPKSPFADIRVRQAIQYGINRDEMNQAILGGYGQVTNGMVTKDSWGFNPNIVGYPYNPDKAKQLLSDAGYGPNNPLKTNYYYRATSPNTENALAVQGYCKAIGVTLNAVPTSAVVIATYQVKWDGMVAILTVANPDPAASLRDSYTGLDARYFGEMLVPADYKAAITGAVTAADFASKQKFTQQADQLFTDKYALAATWAIQAQACGKQSWLHDDGLYKFACSSLWSPENAWKEAGH